MRRDGPVKFEKDFDFESANAQFNKEEIDREFQSKLKLKGTTQLSQALKIFDSKNLIGGGQLMRYVRMVTHQPVISPNLSCYYKHR